MNTQTTLLLFRRIVALALACLFVPKLLAISTPIEVHSFRRNAVQPRLLICGSGGNLYGATTTHPAVFTVTNSQIKVLAFLDDSAVIRWLAQTPNGSLY